MASRGTLETLLLELSKVLKPLATAAKRAPVPQGIIDLAADAGLDLNEILVDATPLTAFSTAFGNAYAFLEPIAESGEIGDLSQVPALFDSLRVALDKIDELDDLQIRPEADPDLAQVGRRVLEFLLVNYLRRYRRPVYHLLLLGGAVEEAKPKERKPAKLDLAVLPKLLQDPLGVFRTTYKWGTNDFNAYLLLTRLQALGWYIGVPGVLHYPGSADATALGSDPTQPDPDMQLRFPILVLERAGVAAQVGLSLLPLRATAARLPGLALVPFGAGSVSESIELGAQWWFTMQVAADVTVPYGFTMRPDGVELASLGPGAPPPEVDLSAAIERRTPSPESRVLVGNPEGARIEIGTIGLRFGASYDGDLDFMVELAIQRGRVAVEATDADGFLKRILPPKGIVAPFDMTLGWSSKEGLYFRGGAELKVDLTVNMSILGVLEVNVISIALKLAPEGMKLAGAATVRVRLGPLTIAVEEIGVSAEFTFPSQGGNLGPLNAALGFKPPKGAGLVIDASAVIGGGYLFFDFEKEQYAGVLELSIQSTLSLKAVGLLTTRMPDGSSGFSLVIIITADFPPIQLGFGFSLLGVGGLLGANRTMVVDVLRSGLKNGTLGSVLFPKNVVANAPKILSDLQAIFPPAPGRFVIGPMVKLVWGTPAIITLELGIVIELPSPVQLVLLGRLLVVLPEEKSAIIFLQLDVLGEFAFATADVRITATLYDSRIAAFALTGDMALRANFGASPAFALAVGGFHPRFQPPPDFPPLERLALTLSDSDNPRLRLETYFAVTSNTIQFGARLDVYAAREGIPFVGTLSVEAMLSFDALFRFEPFEFMAEMRGMAALKHNGKTVVGLEFDFSLTGPAPLHAWGSATLHFLGKHRIAVDMAIGAPQPQPPLPPGDPQGGLMAELARQGNWSARVPAAAAGGGSMLVTFRSVQPGTDVLVHPLGELTVRQKTVPFGVEIQKFGATKPAGARRFEVTRVTLDGTAVPAAGWQSVYDHFAPGEFFALSDDEKLARPAYESLKSGLTVGIGGLTVDATDASKVVEATIEYETAVVDEPDKPSRALADQPLDAALLEVLAQRGAAAASPLRMTGAAKFAGPPQRIVVREPAYAVAASDDLKAPGVGVPGVTAPTGTSYTEMEEARRKSTGGGRLQTVGAHEVLE